MEHVIIPAFFVFVGNGHLQHAGAGWEESPVLPYQVYIIPSHVSLEDAIYFAFKPLFPFSLVQPIQPVMIMMIMMLLLRMISLCEIADIV